MISTIAGAINTCIVCDGSVAYNAGVYRSSDGGNHWTKINTSVRQDEISSITFAPTGEIFAGIAGGYFHSENNRHQWKKFTVSSYARPTSILLNSSGQLFAFIEYGGGIHRSS